MKNTLLALALAAGAFTSAQAGITYQVDNTLSHSVTSDGTAFEFAKFNPTLGTLTAIQIFINSSVDSGSFKVRNTSNSAAKVYNPIDALSVVGPAAYYYNGGNVHFSTAPTLPTTAPVGRNLAASTTQTYTIGSTDVLANGRDQQSLDYSYFPLFTGSGTVEFDAMNNPTVSVTGNGYSTDMSGILNTTEMEVIYTYTAAVVASVPEPSQVAASLLLVSGIAGFVIVRRKALIA